MSIGSHNHLLGSQLCGFFGLLSQLHLTNFLLLNLLNLYLKLSLLFLLPARPLHLFAGPLSILSFKAVIFLLNFPFSCLLSRLLFQLKNHHISLEIHTLLAFPDTIWHAFEVCAEQMVRLVTLATVDEVARVLALKAIVRIL